MSALDLDSMMSICGYRPARIMCRRTCGLIDADPNLGPNESENKFTRMRVTASRFLRKTVKPSRSGGANIASCGLVKIDIHIENASPISWYHTLPIYAPYPWSTVASILFMGPRRRLCAYQPTNTSCQATHGRLPQLISFSSSLLMALRTVTFRY